MGNAQVVALLAVRVAAVSSGGLTPSGVLLLRADT
jgi:hypothetical protein